MMVVPVSAGAQPIAEELHFEWRGRSCQPFARATCNEQPVNDHVRDLRAGAGQ